jgi:hypothetical protein
MTAPTLIDGLTPPVAPDVASIASMLARRFPGAVVWFGAYTRRWWAMACLGGQLRFFEAASPDELTRAIINGHSLATLWPG